MEDDDVIHRMRSRVKQMRKLKSLAHDPRMIAIIDRVAEEIEAVIRRLEAENEGQRSTRH